MVQIFVQTSTLTMLNDCRLAQPQVVGVEPTDLPLPSTTLRPHPLLRTIDLDGEHVAAFVPSVSEIAVLNQPALALLRRLPLVEAAEAEAHLGALVTLAARGLLVTAEEPGIPSPPASTVLGAWLHVSNACNLRCTYCYIEKSAEMMAVATALKSVDTIIEAALRHGYREIALKYAGGEPLLALDVLAAAHAHARSRCAAAGLGLRATVLSNGTVLTRERAARLRDLGFELTISLDALTVANDRLRPTLAGRASTSAVLAGIEAAIAEGLSPGVAITVTRGNISHVPGLVEWLLQRKLPFTLSLYRENDSSYGRADLLSEEGELIDGLRRIYATVDANPPSWSVLGALLDRADLSHAHSAGCAAGEHYLVIDHHGNIAKCQMALGSPVATIADPDPLSMIRLDPRLPLGRTVDEKEGCRSCEWRYWCGGGCPIATLRATGRTDVRSPNCNIYQALYPDLIRLEGRRLLRWSHTARTA